MGRNGPIIFLLSLIVATQVAAARVMPSGLTDQKNVINYGGVGGFNGVGDNGMPFGGVGGGYGSNGGPFGNIGGGGLVGTNPQGGLAGVYGTVPGGTGSFNFPGIGGAATGGFGNLGGGGGGAGGLTNP